MNPPFPFISYLFYRWAIIALSGNRAPDVSATAGFVPRSTSAPRTDTSPLFGNRNSCTTARPSGGCVPHGCSWARHLLYATTTTPDTVPRDCLRGRRLGFGAGATFLQNTLEFACIASPVLQPLSSSSPRRIAHRRRTGIPRHPDPPGQLLQRVLLFGPASELRFRWVLQILAGSAAIVVTYLRSLQTMPVIVSPYKA